MSTLAIVVNPWARGGRGLGDWNEHARHALEARLALMGESRTRLNVYLPDDASRGPPARAELALWLETRVLEGERRFLSVGGDGTMNLVLNLLFALARKHALESGEFQLGAIGLGSSNDFHKCLGGNTLKLARKFPARIEFARAARADVGCLTGASGQETHFAINFSVGLTAVANERFNNPGPLLAFLKRTSTEAAIAGAAVHTALHYANVPMKIAWNGRAVECHVANLSLIKKNHFAGSFYYDEAPSSDDGRLGLYLFSDLTRSQTLAQMIRLTRGKFGGQHRDFTSDVTLESAAPFLAEADGEVHQLTRARVYVKQRSIQLCP